MTITGATTATSLTELINTEFINTFIADALGNYKNPSQFLLPINITNGSSTVSQPRWVSDIGTPPDDGVAVDLEFDATEATALVANELETTDATFSVVEYGLLREPSDTAMEDASISIMGSFVGNAAAILMDAMNDDACATFASFTASAGTSGTNCRISDVDDALYDLNRRGVRGEAVAVMDTQAMDDFRGELTATNSNAAVYAMTADRIMGVTASADGGRNAEGLVLRYKNTDFYQQGLTDTANAGADVVSAIFVRGDIPSQQGSAAIGQASRRPFQLETIRVPAARTTQFVFTARWGCGLINNQMGCKLVTDA